MRSSQTDMTTQSDEDERADFYSSAALNKYIGFHGVPRSVHAFRDMVAAGVTEDLASAEGIRLIECLGQVTFFQHPMQINVMDKSSGKIIASILR